MVLRYKYYIPHDKKHEYILGEIELINSTLNIISIYEPKLVDEFNKFYTGLSKEKQSEFLDSFTQARIEANSSHVTLCDVIKKTPINQHKQRLQSLSYLSSLGLIFRNTIQEYLPVSIKKTSSNKKSVAIDNNMRNFTLALYNASKLLTENSTEKIATLLFYKHKSKSLESAVPTQQETRRYFLKKQSGNFHLIIQDLKYVKAKKGDENKDKHNRITVGSTKEIKLPHHLSKKIENSLRIAAECERIPKPQPTGKPENISRGGESFQNLSSPYSNQSYAPTQTRSSKPKTTFCDEEENSK